MDIMDIAREQGISPDVFQQMQPIVQQSVNGFGGGRNLTDMDIDRMTNDVVMNGRSRGLNLASDAARLLVLLSLYNTYGYDLNPFWYMYYGGIPWFWLPFINYRRSFGPPFFGRPPFRPGFRPPHGGGFRPRPPHGGGGRPPHGGGGRPPHGGGGRPRHGGGGRPPHGGGHGHR